MNDEVVLRDFWRLYGSGLLGHAVPDFEPLTPKQWRCLQSLARRNSLYGLVLEGIGHLPAHQQPPKAVAQAWALEMAQSAYYHGDTNRVIVDLFERWRQAGVHAVLLKGQGYARLYPTPELRMIGDIDVFVGYEQFDRAMQVVRTLDLDSDDFPDIGKHLEFFYRGKVVELHRRSARIFHHLDRDADYQQWSEATLLGSPEGFCIDARGRYADGSGEWVATAPPTFNAFFTFMHLWGHMYIGITRVRSLADWVMVLRHYKAAIDHAELERRLRQFDLLDYWQQLACFVVRYLGVDPADIPCYDPAKMPSHKKWYRYLSGEVAWRPYVPHGRVAAVRKMRTLRYYVRYHCHRLGIFPTSTVLKEFWRAVAQGIRWNLGGDTIIDDDE